MLRILDNYNPAVSYEFRMRTVQYENGWKYTLNNATLQLYDLEFKMPHLIDSFHNGFSVSVYLLKNRNFAQRDVIEVRIPEVTQNNGRIGYITQLSAIFDPGILTVHKHLHSYFYYALGNIFYNDDFKQTKTPNFSKTTFDISDFFDDDVLLLMTCDQITAGVPNFKIENYTAALYEKGFYFIEPTEESFFQNTSSYVNTNYTDLYATRNRFGYLSVRLEATVSDLLTDDFAPRLFKKHLLKKVDPETRFLMLYQVIELLIPKILTIELRKTITAPNQLESFKLKDKINELAKEGTRISHLFTTYSHIVPGIGNNLHQEIYNLLQHIGFTDYADPYTPGSVADIFYDFRNKLLHSHRTFKAPALSESFIQNSLININSLIELLIINITNSYHS